MLYPWLLFRLVEKTLLSTAVQPRTGAISVMFFGDRIGRRKTIFIGIYAYL